MEVKDLKMGKTYGGGFFGGGGFGYGGLGLVECRRRR